MRWFSITVPYGTVLGYCTNTNSLNNTRGIGGIGVKIKIIKNSIHLYLKNELFCTVQYGAFDVKKDTLYE